MSASKSKRKDSASFADIDSFWDNRDVSVDSPDESVETDKFQYDTSSSISESDLEDASVAPSVASKSSKKTSNDTSRNSFLNSSTNSSRMSASLPLEDSEEEDATVGRRSSVAGSNITGGKSSVSSTPKVTPSRGRPPSTDKSKAKGYFNYDSSVNASVNVSSIVETPASVGKSKRVSFSAEKPAPYINDDQDDVNNEDYEFDEPAVIEEPTPVVPSTKKRGRPSKKTSNIKYKEYDPKTPGSTEFRRGRQMPDSSFTGSAGKAGRTEGESSESSEEDESGFVDTSYLQDVREKGHLSASSDSDSDGGRKRRSKRVTKGMRYQFWKNERPVYEEGRIVGVLTAEPTPMKPKKKKRKGEQQSRVKRIKLKSDDFVDSESSEDDAKKAKKHPFVLPKQYDYTESLEGELLNVWDDVTNSSAELKVLSNRENLNPPSSLPITADRPPGKEKAALAAQSFNVPEVPGKMSGWISGFVELPPEAIKDAEGVGLCSQVFFIGSCQDGAVEVGMASPDSDTWDDSTAQRRLLSTGDTFFVPPGNIYRVENHSTYKTCTIYWTIIKPIAESLPADSDF